MWHRISGVLALCQDFFIHKAPFTTLFWDPLSCKAQSCPKVPLHWLLHQSMRTERMLLETCKDSGSLATHWGTLVGSWLPLFDLLILLTVCAGWSANCGWLQPLHHPDGR